MKRVAMSVVVLLILPGFFSVQDKGLVDISSKPTGVDIYIRWPAWPTWKHPSRVVCASFRRAVMPGSFTLLYLADAL